MIDSDIYTVTINELYAGMVEGVVALVPRVEDTVEFEVQPLREKNGQDQNQTGLTQFLETSIG